MWIEHPPKFFRKIYHDALFLVATRRREVFLTFDDGPVPEMTPLVLDILDRHGVKATFFMVGDNARKYPELVEEVRRRGHRIGNHTMHHLQGMKTPTEKYMEDVKEADRLLASRLFRPPHGILRRRQLKELLREYRVVMYDVVTRDYSRRLTADDVVDNVRQYVRPGSIIVFHDSLKSLARTPEALPRAIEWLKGEGYEFALIPEKPVEGNE